MEGREMKRRFFVALRMTILAAAVMIGSQQRASAQWGWWGEKSGDDTLAEGYQSIEEVVVRLLYYCSAVKQLIFYGKLRYIYCMLT